MMELRYQREQMRRDGLIHGESHYPVSLTLIIALMLLAVGILAVVSMLYHAGPFGSS
jgi:putative membrane protein